MGRMVLAGIMAVALAGMLTPMGVRADTQGYGMGPMTLVSAQTLTNNGTYTLNAQTNLPGVAAWGGTVQLMAIIGPAGANAPTNGNYCTNLVLVFDKMIGTNVTTDHPFTWTIGTNQLGVLSANALTNPVVVCTNLTAQGGLSGLQLSTALGSSTNALGFKLTVLVQVQRN